MKTVSCIIAAYNEAPRIGAVLQAVAGHPLIQEVIVIDDGSHDNTAEAARKFPGVTVIVNEHNKGKSYSVATGIEQAKGELIMMVDADLIGLTQQSVTDLIEPVLNGLADITISLRSNSLWIYKQLGLDFVSGERVFAKSTVQDRLEEVKQLAGYGLETFFNEIIIKDRLKIKVVYWDSVSITKKFQKESEPQGLLNRMKNEMAMIREILKVGSFFELVTIFIRMSSLKVK